MSGEGQGDVDRFIGRRAELSQLAALFGSGPRLVTLVGPPGVGKSRLALQAVREAKVAGAQVAHWAAGTPGSSRDELHGVELLLVDALEPDDVRRPLLLSALEHLPKLRALATSSGPLEIAGEVLLPVAPLRLPEPGTELASSEAVELLIERARAAGAVALEPVQAAEIARRLEGIPLALELAARRLMILQPDDLLQHLDDLPELQRAFDAAIARLPGPLAQLLAQLSVFDEGFSQDAAQAIVEPAPGSSLVDALALLRARGLLMRVTATGARLTLLRPVQRSARALALRLGLLATAEARHLTWFAAQAEQRGGDRDALHWVANETGNLRAAAQRAFVAPSSSAMREQGLRALLAFEELVLVGGMFAGQGALLDLALTDRSGLSPLLLARSLDDRARLREHQGEAELALQDNLESSAIAAETGDESLVRRCAMTAISLAPHRGGPDGRVLEWTQLLTEARQRRDGRTEARVLLEIACLEQERQRHGQAHRLLLQALGRARSEGMLALEVATLGRLAENLVEQGRPREALPLLEAGLALVRTLGHPQAQSILRGAQALACHLAGELAQARAFYLLARDLFDAVWSDPYTELLLEIGLALVALEERDVALSRKHFEQSLRLTRRVAAPQADAIASLVEAALSPELAQRLSDARPLMEHALSTSARPWLRYVRFALGILDRIASAPTGPRMRISPDASAFSLGAGPSVSLAKRAALRRILAHLAHLHRDYPGRAASADEIFAVGWPDTTARPDSARSRVYVAVNTLRRLGLDTHLANDGDGYLLDPSLNVDAED